MKSSPAVEVSVEQFIKRVVADGGHFLVGEYRGSAVAPVEYLDKESGKKEVYVKVVHSIEVRGGSGLETVHLQEMIDRSVTPEQYKEQCNFAPGMRIIVAPRRVETDKGIKKFTCTSAEIQRLSGSGQQEGIGKK